MYIQVLFLYDKNVQYLRQKQKLLFIATFHYKSISKHAFKSNNTS